MGSILVGACPSMYYLFAGHYTSILFNKYFRMINPNYAVTPTVGDVAFVNVGGRIEGSEAGEAVADDLAAERNGLLGIATYLGKGETATRQSGTRCG
jgi:hypothetical protein